MMVTTHCIRALPIWEWGANTILTQMACEALGCLMESMTVVESDTDIVPFDPGSYASSTTYVTGTAAKMAAEELRER